MVIHDYDGGRIACGIISEAQPTGCDHVWSVGTPWSNNETCDTITVMVHIGWWWFQFFSRLSMLPVMFANRLFKRIHRWDMHRAKAYMTKRACLIFSISKAQNLKPWHGLPHGLRNPLESFSWRKASVGSRWWRNKSWSFNRGRWTGDPVLPSLVFGAKRSCTLLEAHPSWIWQECVGSYSSLWANGLEYHSGFLRQTWLPSIANETSEPVPQLLPRSRSGGQFFAAARCIFDQDMGLYRCRRDAHGGSVNAHHSSINAAVSNSFAQKSTFYSRFLDACWLPRGFWNGCTQPLAGSSGRWWWTAADYLRLWCCTTLLSVPGQSACAILGRAGPFQTSWRSITWVGHSESLVWKSAYNKSRWKVLLGTPTKPHCFCTILEAEAWLPLACKSQFHWRIAFACRLLWTVFWAVWHQAAGLQSPKSSQMWRSCWAT